MKSPGFYPSLQNDQHRESHSLKTHRVVQTSVPLQYYSHICQKSLPRKINFNCTVFCRSSSYVLPKPVQRVLACLGLVTDCHRHRGGWKKIPPVHNPAITIHSPMRAYILDPVAGGVGEQGRNPTQMSVVTDIAKLKAENVHAAKSIHSLLLRLCFFSVVSVGLSLNH